MGAKLSLKKSESTTEQVLQAIDRFYAEASNLKQTHIPVATIVFKEEGVPDIELFLKEPDGQFKVYRKQGLYLSPVELDNLASNGRTELYLARADVPIFTQFADELLCKQPPTSPMVDEKKVTLLRGSAVKVMSDIFENPTPQNIEKGVKTVSNFVYMLMRDPKAYQILLSLSSHDHYTLQHSVGVGTNSIILASKFGVTDERTLIEVGVGGLLHDIGKTKVAKEIINKKGPLDESEWVEMRKHSMYGYEIIKDNPNIGTRAKLAILQHHEEPAGKGYPMGLSGSQIDLFAQIVTLADIYNALTTDRSYSTAKQPFEAFDIIKAKLAHKINPQLFEAMVKIYGTIPKAA